MSLISIKEMYIRVKVMAGSRKESLKKIKEDSFEIKIKEKSENNLANKRVLELLALYFNVTINAISIKSGHHKPQKLIIIRI